MSTPLRFLLQVIAITACTSATFAADAPPVAPVRPVTDDYHGTKVEDPYRYFENFTDPEVQAWVKGQGDCARRTLDAIPGRDAMLKRIAELDAGAPYRIRVVRRLPDGGLHYLKRMASENLDKLYYSDPAGNERLLIDPERMKTPDGGHVSIEFAVPSHDRRYVAYGLAAAGSEQTVLHVLDVAAGKDLPDVIDRIEPAYTEPSWLPDTSGFVYSRRQKLASGTPATEGYKNTRAYLHRLGDDPESDRVIFSKDVPGAAVPMTETDFPSVVIPTGSVYAIAQIKNGDTPELTLYATQIARLGNSGTHWTKVCDAKDQVKQFAVKGEEIYLVTSADGAPRYRVVRTRLDRPDFANAKTAVPHGERVVESIGVAGDALYVNVLEAGISRVARVRFDARTLQPIELPDGMASGFAFAAEPDVGGAYVGTESWTRGGRIYLYDPIDGKLTDTGLAPQGKFDNVPGYESHEVRVKSHDGVDVPLSILHKTGLKLDGTAPTLLTGYGSYGHVANVDFDPTNLAWLERGGVLAIAHVRGGGEFGQAWHLAGRMATKPNTWKDFIACGEYLVRERYTSPSKLAGMGTSAGGITIGRAITDRPDLFAAACVNVGCTDLLRAETTTNGVPNIQEFGTVKTKEGFDALLAMSPYHHVKPNTKYPAVLLTHGINDPRVDPWMSAKLTARLQTSTISGKPILFRVDYQAGHGMGSTKTQRQERVADTWAFLLWQMGEMGQ